MFNGFKVVFSGFSFQNQALWSSSGSLHGAQPLLAALLLREDVVFRGKAGHHGRLGSGRTGTSENPKRFMFEMPRKTELKANLKRLLS